jgi:hypothetical protein
MTEEKDHPMLIKQTWYDSARRQGHGAVLCKQTPYRLFALPEMLTG